MMDTDDQGAPTGVFRDPNSPRHVLFFPIKGLDISGRYNPIWSDCAAHALVYLISC